MTRARGPLTGWRHLAAPVCAAALLAPIPAPAGTCSGLSLSLGSPGAVGAVPSAIAVGDFDRDGRLDAVTVNGGTSNFTVLLGDGVGGLAFGSTLITTPSPVDVAVGDLDRDGRLDLVVASGASAQVATHRGGAGGSFGPNALFGTGFVPHRVALADVDRDGWLDLVVVSQASHRVRVFRGIGLTFVSTPLADIDLSASSPSPSAVAVGDWVIGTRHRAILMEQPGALDELEPPGHSWLPRLSAAWQVVGRPPARRRARPYTRGRGREPRGFLSA